MNPRDLLIGILVPGIVAATILFFAWKLASSAARRDKSASAPAAAIAVSLGSLAGFCALFGWNYRPVESWLWMIWVFPALALLGALEARASSTFLVAALLRIAACGVAMGLVLRKLILHAGPGVDTNRLALYVGTPVIAISLWRSVFPFLSAGVGSAALWMVSTASAVMVLLAHSMKLAQIGGALAGTLGALIVACLLRPSVKGLAGALTPVAVILSCLVFLSLEYSSMGYSVWLFALVGLAPALGVLPFVKKPWMKIALIAIPIAIAVALAFRTYDTSAL